MINFENSCIIHHLPMRPFLALSRWTKEHVICQNAENSLHIDCSPKCSSALAGNRYLPDSSNTEHPLFYEIQ